MPDTSPLSGVRVPLGPEANVVPADLKRMRDDQDPHLVLFAIDEADRDARYGDVPVGVLVSATGKYGLWRKTSTGWVTVWSFNEYDPAVSTVSEPAAIRAVRMGGAVFWDGLIQLPEGYTPASYLMVCSVPSTHLPRNNSQRFPTTTVNFTSHLRILDGNLQVWAEAYSATYIPVTMSYPVSG